MSFCCINCDAAAHCSDQRSDTVSDDICVDCIAACLCSTLCQGCENNINLNGEEVTFTSPARGAACCSFTCIEVGIMLLLQRALSFHWMCEQHFGKQCHYDYARLNLSTLVSVRKAIPCAHCHARSSHVSRQSELRWTTTRTRHWLCMICISILGFV